MCSSAYSIEDALDIPLPPDEVAVDHKQQACIRYNDKMLPPLVYAPPLGICPPSFGHLDHHMFTAVPLESYRNAAVISVQGHPFSRDEQPGHEASSRLKGISFKRRSCSVDVDTSAVKKCEPKSFVSSGMRSMVAWPRGRWSNRSS